MDIEVGALLLWHYGMSGPYIYRVEEIRETDVVLRPMVVSTKDGDDRVFDYPKDNLDRYVAGEWQRLVIPICPRCDRPGALVDYLCEACRYGG
jgi:hypothetical protein